MSAPEIAETDSERSKRDSSLFLAVTIIASKVVALLSVDSSVFFNDAATTEIYTLSLHVALPI